MNLSRRAFLRSILWCCISLAPAGVLAQTSPEPFEPTVGQAGKDVVWVPTPPFLVETMLDMAQVKPQDFVIDLGSGDGRNVIAAAKRGARARGVEYNADLVELSRHAAVTAGVADKVVFVQGDMYEADISEATVLALYLLAENLRKLVPKFLSLKAGTRIVINTFGIDGWKADENDRGPGECTSWCSARLYIVPAKVAGTWRLSQGELTLAQEFQMVSGTFTRGGESLPIENGRLRGNQFHFTAGGVSYVARVNGDAMDGTTTGIEKGTWIARRSQ